MGVQPAAHGPRDPVTGTDAGVPPHPQVMLLPTIPLPPDEDERLEALRRYQVLDTEPEEDFDDIVRIASRICGTPVGLITLLDEERQWFKARTGLDLAETDRRLAFCSHTILDRAPLVVEDATRDRRFADNPLVAGEPGVRFYAGAPLVTPDGHGLGSLCVIDVEPRELDPARVSALEALARTAMRRLELRRSTLELGRALERAATLARMVPVCSFCRRVRRDDEFREDLETFLEDETGTRFSRGRCPDCAESAA